MLRTIRRKIFPHKTSTKEIYGSSLSKYHRCAAPVHSQIPFFFCSSPLTVIKLLCAHNKSMIGRQASDAKKNKSTKYEIESINQLPNLAFRSDTVKRVCVCVCCRRWQRLITTHADERNWLDCDHDSHFFTICHSSTGTVCMVFLLNYHLIFLWFNSNLFYPHCHHPCWVFQQQQSGGSFSCMPVRSSTFGRYLSNLINGSPRLVR